MIQQSTSTLPRTFFSVFTFRLGKYRNVVVGQSVSLSVSLSVHASLPKKLRKFSIFFLVMGIWMMLMNLNGFLLHYVRSLRWDLDILLKEMKKKREKKRKKKTIRFVLTNDVCLQSGVHRPIFIEMSYFFRFLTSKG